MELHVTTAIAGSPALDPASLAAAWICQASDADIQIMPSGNPGLSPTHTLPVLLGSDMEPISGLPEIAAKVLNRELDPAELSLLAYYQQLSVITQWTLFVIPENYEALTRPEISAAIPFPMQYNAALALQRDAAANQPRKNQSVAKPPTEPINKLHEDMLKQNEIRWKAKDTPKQTISRMTQFVDIIDTSKAVLSDLSEDSPARLLLAANLVLTTLNRLPVKPLMGIIDQRPELVKLRDYGLSLNYQMSKLTLEIPAGRTYTLWNTLMAYKRSFLG